MYMQLSTGLVTPLTTGDKKKYGIDNLKLIVRSAVNLGKVIAKVRNNPVPAKFLGKVWYWIFNLFSNRTVFTEIGKDLVQLAAHADEIKQELMDLDADEIEELANSLGIADGVSTPNLLLKKLPAMLDAIKSFAEIIS